VIKLCATVLGETGALSFVAAREATWQPPGVPVKVP
jgi:hypothetical protein